MEQAMQSGPARVKLHDIACWFPQYPFPGHRSMRGGFHRSFSEARQGHRGHFPLQWNVETVRDSESTNQPRAENRKAGKDAGALMSVDTLTSLQRSASAARAPSA